MSYRYPTDEECMEACRLLLKEAASLELAPAPESIFAAYTVAGYALYKGFPLKIADEHSSLDLAKARLMAKPHLEKIGDGTILKQVLPVVLPLVLKILEQYLGGAAA